MKHLLLTTIAANFGFSSIPWWCYVIVFLLLFGFIKKRLGQTIHKHAIEGNIRAIKKLVNSKGVACLEAKDEEGCSPLHYAAASGHKETVEFLIDNNANVNYKSDNEGYIPLHGAAIGGHREIIDLLKADFVEEDFSEVEEVQLYSAGCSTDEKIKTVENALRIYFPYASVEVSHDLLASARALCDHPRNLDDEQLGWIKNNGGVVHVVALGSYLKAEKQKNYRMISLNMHTLALNLVY